MQRVAAAAAIANAPSLSPHVVHVVHFDSRIDGVETTSLEAFLKVHILSRPQIGVHSPWFHTPRHC